MHHTDYFLSPALSYRVAWFKKPIEKPNTQPLFSTYSWGLTRGLSNTVAHAFVCVTSCLKWLQRSFTPRHSDKVIMSGTHTVILNLVGFCGCNPSTCADKHMDSVST